ncbi:MAG: glycosyl hydrolase 115 family protein [Terracidiphilus sp.]
MPERRCLFPFAAALVFSVAPVLGHALGEPRYVSNKTEAGAFALADRQSAVPLLVSNNDWPGVLRAAGDLSADIDRVTGEQPTLLHVAADVHNGDVVLIGTIGRSTLIDDLVRRHKLDVSGIAGQWETAVTTIVERPMPGVRRALVIAGSDKRGTIFAIYDLSEQIGVSPWYWWADVRVPHQDALFVAPGRHAQPVPAVRYRGIFLNDEAPALTGWVNEKYGGYNSKFYVHVFELLLRLKANFLWPAMWNSAFAADDPENARLADEYGIVMSTSHEEPMMRAEKEWMRTDGPWNYAENQKRIDDFWRTGMERDKKYEEIVTLGMRGVNDTPMSASANSELLEKIVANQRQILKETVNPDLEKVPQVWALYKEVQSYYDNGMRVPDDVTLLWSDDNWGNLRRLPTPEERKRAGGAGIYYHFDYVGDPRSYKWLNTNPIPKIWEQMNLAFHYGADRIWVVNVGDLKPMEFPIEFFLTMARTPGRWNQNNLDEYTRLWATREFGPEHAAEIAAAVEDYTRYNGRRKPELIDANTFSLTTYHETDRVEQEWKSLAARVDKLADELPEDERASFFELVQYPVDACANLTELYIAAGRNTLFARQGRASANNYADEARTLFAKDAALTDQYNHKLLNGRWNHMMDQTHIGYTFWNEPPLNAMPAVTEVQPAAVASFGVAVEGGLGFRPSLGQFDSVAQQTRTLTLFNRGLTPVEFQITTSDPWIVVSQNSGTVSNEDLALDVHVDWAGAPTGFARGSVTVSQKGAAPIVVPLEALRLPGVTRANAEGFVESDGYVAIEAADTTARAADADVQWEELPGFGETRSAMTVFPVTAASSTSSEASLQYRMYLYGSGGFTLETVLAPTLNFVPGRGLRFSVSVDDGPRTIVDALEHNTQSDWAQAVRDGVKKVSIPLTIASPGYHTLKVWMVDPGVVLERIVLSHSVLPSYLGPPESFHATQPTSGQTPAVGTGSTR